VGRLLLIGNSRWHWAERSGQALQCWHGPAGEAIQPADLEAWAAVGSVPSAESFTAVRRVGLADVPLQGIPPWLGIDRALVGWGAWHQQRQSVLVADAGTALSLTRVDAEGCFAGGLISAGVALQLRALAAATAQLPAVNSAGADPAPPAAAWPTATAAAMDEGCRRAVAAAIAAAAACAEGAQLWLTGGDAELLLPLLLEQHLHPEHAPNLAMEAMAALPVLGGYR
jgi:type III pantothenate kinase